MPTAVEMRDRLIALHDNRLFQAVVIGVILLSALVIGANTYEVSPTWRRVITSLDVGITVFFLIEILIRIAAEKHGIRQFFKKGWNTFDFVIVTMSLIPIEGSQLVLLGRLLRVFRVLRLISIIPELRLLLNALLKAIPRMGYVALLMFIIFYIYGAVGSFMFENVNPTLWSDVAIAMLTLFRVATFEDWTDVMYETMAVYPLSWMYFLSFIFLAAFVFLNMMIGVILDVMQREHLVIDMELAEADEAPPGASAEDDPVQRRLARIEAKLDALTGGLAAPALGSGEPAGPLGR